MLKAFCARGLLRSISNTVKHVKFFAVGLSERAKLTSITVVGDPRGNITCHRENEPQQVASGACAATEADGRDPLAYV